MLTLALVAAFGAFAFKYSATEVNAVTQASDEPQPRRVIRDVEPLPVVASKVEAKPEVKLEPKSVAVAVKSNCECADGCKCEGVCTCPKTPVVTAKEKAKAEPVAEVKPVVVPQPKPKAIVIEESTITDDPKEAEKIAKEKKLPLFRWYAGIEKTDRGDVAINAIGAKAVHLLADKENDGDDKVGPRLTFKGDDGFKYYVPVDKLNEKSIPKIIGKALKYTDSSFPQVDIPQAYRMRNFSDRPGDGNCLWVSIDPLLKMHGYKVSLSQNRWGGGSINKLAPPYATDPRTHLAVVELEKRGVSFVSKDHFSGKNLGILQQACDEKLGAVVTICINTPGGMQGHALDLVGINEKQVATIDNNDPQLKPRSVSLASFKKMWDGGAIVILPKDYAGTLKQHSVKQCQGPQCRPANDPFQMQVVPQPRPQFGDGQEFDPDAPNNTGSMLTPIVGASKETGPTVDETIQFLKEAGYTQDEIAKRLARK